MRDEMAERYLEMKSIYKSYPGVKALQNVNFSVDEGEIVALVGEKRGRQVDSYEYFGRRHQKGQG